MTATPQIPGPESSDESAAFYFGGP